MSDHDLSPAQEAANGLPTDALARAAEAIDACEDTGYDPEQLVHIFITPALPILRPAIEAALVERMIADVKGHRGDWIGQTAETFINRPVPLWDKQDVIDCLWGYLPATTEGATDHD